MHAFPLLSDVPSDVTPDVSQALASERAALCSGCPVCGSPEVRTDWVDDGGWVRLRECPRCQHRSADPVPEPLAVCSPVRAREGAAAA